MNPTTLTTEIRTATDDEQIRSCYKIMLQLRPHLNSEQAFVSQVQRQIQEGYYLAYIQDADFFNPLTKYEENSLLGLFQKLIPKQSAETLN